MHDASRPESSLSTTDPQAETPPKDPRPAGYPTTRSEGQEPADPSGPKGDRGIPASSPGQRPTDAARTK